MRHGKLYKAGLIAASLAFIVVAGQMQRELNRERKTLGLTRIEPLENAPPVLAFTTVALGGFRGLIANILWVRAAQMQEEGKYFEMVQIADWISKLQPYSTHVWLVQAWNMSYNISVKFVSPADRWRWVQRGVELLRDQGLAYNPKDTMIYRELAWHFQHKIGHLMDDAHLYYKYHWAEEMTAVLKSGRPDFDELIHPKTEEARERAALLRTKYKLQPDVMKAVDEKYGPLDWRLPDAHAIYWAFLGLRNSNPKELITLRRVIYQSMIYAVQRGRLIGLGADGRPRLGPNYELVQRTYDTYEEEKNNEPTMRDHIQIAQRNFLKEAIYLLYANGRIREARRWFDFYQKTYPGFIPANKTLDAYALENIFAEAQDLSRNKVVAIIESYLEQSFVLLIDDEDDESLNYERIAREIWTRYHANIGPSQERVGLEPFEEIRMRVLQDLLDPDTGLDPRLAAVLRTKLKLPASGPLPQLTAPPVTAPTNAPAANTNAPNVKPSVIQKPVEN